MAKANSIDLRLQRLVELAAEPDSDASRQELRRGLRDASNLVVAKAVEIIGERELTEFTDELKLLWPPLIEEPLERDKGCAAKIAILDALARFSFDDPDFCLAGMKYVQIEPGWPSAFDSAVNVRGGCAAMLARSWKIGVNDKLIAMTELLNDCERLARVHAVHAIADVGHECVIPMLRIKAQCGDLETEVTGACFSELLRLTRQDAVPFVARYLQSDIEQLASEAAAALGECGLPEATNLLIEAWKGTPHRETKQSFLIALGLSRQPLAVEFLISLLNPVTNSSEPTLRALAPLRFYPDILNRVRSALEATQNRRLLAIFRELFGVD